MRIAAALVLVAACYRPATFANCEIACGDGQVCPDDFTCSAIGLCQAPGGATCSPIDARPVGGDAVLDAPRPDAPSDCFGSPGAIVQVCPQAGFTPPTSFQYVGGFIVDTDGGQCAPPSDVLPFPDDTTVTPCIVIGDTVDITGDIKVIGSRPLVLVAITKLTIDGDIQVANHGTENPTCGHLQDDGAASPAAPASGGAGGSYQGRGGHGSDGQDTIHASNGGGVAGEPLPTPTHLYPGCRGGHGGGGTNAGDGGGVIALIAPMLDLEAKVYAVGFGADGGAGNGQPPGGGGGGAGGLIAIDTPLLTIGSSSFLAATGGGGGAGAPTASTGAPGMPGALTGGPGGNTPGSVGGAGELDPSIDGRPAPAAQSTSGGGGGGGAAGYILVRAGAVPAGLAAVSAPTPTAY